MDPSTAQRFGGVGVMLELIGSLKQCSLNYWLSESPEELVKKCRLNTPMGSDSVGFGEPRNLHF